MKSTQVLSASALAAVPFALAQCTTSTTVELAIDATISDYSSWLNSMNREYSTSGVSFSGETVMVHTSLYSYPGGSFTGYGIYDSDALTRAGYSVVTTTATSISCATSETLPPSPTNSDCEPHGDHWHCEPLSTAAPTVTESEILPPSPTNSDCEPHGDHWHCEPLSTPTATASERTESLPPSPTNSDCEPHGDHWHCEPLSTPAPTATETAACEPHGDHWHCPSGVPEPTTPPSPSHEFSPVPSSSPSPSETPIPVGGSASTVAWTSVNVAVIVFSAVMLSS